jgi:hypothetical protein
MVKKNDPARATGKRRETYSVAAFTIPSMHLFTFNTTSLDIMILVIEAVILFRIDLEFIRHPGLPNC